MAKASILIVEDEQALAKALKLKFEESGYEVAVALNGEEALDHLSKDFFDAVVLDILMPTMDGWDVLKNLQSKGKKILVLSNLSQDEDIQRAFKLGAIDFAVKSGTSLSGVVERIDKLIKNDDHGPNA